MARFVVLFQDPSTGNYECINSPDVDIDTDKVWEAITGQDANGLVAISIQKSGKFVALPVDGPGNASYITTFNFTATDNNLVFTAVDTGTVPNNLRVRFIVAGTSTPLSVVVDGDYITVNLQTDLDDLPISTAAEVRTAVNAYGPSAALVLVTFAPGGAGTGVIDIPVSTDYVNLVGGSTGEAIAQIVTVALTPSFVGSTI